MIFPRDNPAVIIDNGSGFTKAGFAGGAAPQVIIPTAIDKKVKGESGNPLADLNFKLNTGKNSTAYDVKTHYPMKHGVVEDWDSMEQLWQRCYYEKLRCNPEDHYLVLTEPPLNPPINREKTAEIMFETFNIPGMSISVQAVLSLAASWTNEKVAHREMTGCVVDSGFGATHIVPVVDGHVIPSCIKQINIGGRDVTAYIQQLMRERKEEVPHGMGVEVARAIKERYTYTCPNIEKEFERFDSNPEKYIKRYESIHKQTGNKWSCDVQYERFLAPEVAMNPQIYDPSINTSLPGMVDAAIQKCPIDTRRKLYSNIVLSGGNTVFKDFGRRLQRDVKKLVESRLLASRAKAAETLLQGSDVHNLKVNVIENLVGTSSVWLGGSILASSGDFLDSCITKSQYEEEGPRIFRRNIVFNG